MCGSGARRVAGDVGQATRRSLLARFVMPLALLQGAWLQSACSLVPKYTRPDPPVPPAWSGASSQGLKNAIAVRSGWWRSFGSTELSTLVERSLATNYSLQATIARIDEARGTARIAGAPLYPALSLNGTLDRSNGQGTSLQTSRTQNAFGLATYEIDFWGKNRATAESAKALAAASAFDSDTVAMTLTASVADTYLQILSLQERIRLAKTIAHDAERVLSLIEARRSVGTATDIDVEQQRNAVATFDVRRPHPAAAVGTEPALARDPGGRHSRRFRRGRTQPGQSRRFRRRRPTCRPSCCGNGPTSERPRRGSSLPISAWAPPVRHSIQAST